MENYENKTLDNRPVEQRKDKSASYIIAGLAVVLVLGVAYFATKSAPRYNDRTAPQMTVPATPTHTTVNTTPPTP